MSWVEDNTISIKDAVLLELETSVPHEKSLKSTPLRGTWLILQPSAKVEEQKIHKNKFNLHIKPSI